MFLSKGLTWLALSSVATAGVLPSVLSPRALPLESCPGYTATNITTTSTTVTANLHLAGPACNTYGTDLDNLLLLVEYQNPTRLHVKIYDAVKNVYQVPEYVLPRPASYQATSFGPQNSLIFSMVASPFSFAVTRKSNGNVLFNTSGSQIIFQSQYLRMRTQLPANPNLYGLGEHTDPFRLNTTNYIRTLWSRDAYTIPSGTNLYGNHPVYFDHRGSTGTHGVFLLNSNGMDIKINNTASTGQYLEYNTLGGVFDLYFLAGPSPKAVAQQYAETVGHSALMPYWSLGFQQCRYGMQDVYEVAGVVANYSTAGIPLETMWVDIDYMDFRKVFTVDPDRFPLRLMQELVSYLNAHQQHSVLMVDPAVAYQDYPGFNNGVANNAFLKIANGSIYKGVVWPGVTAFPDWFAPGTQVYWDQEFHSFFDPSTGVDISGLWIDMNEASNFCDWPCLDPEGYARSAGDPPRPPAVRLGSPYVVPGFPADFQPQCVARVNFQVTANTYNGENIIMLGNASTIGNGNIANAPGLSANTYPVWQATVDFPVNSTFSYQYIRTESDGSYIYENVVRTVTTGTCNGVVQVVHDTITTSSGPHKLKRSVEAVESVSDFEKRQAAGAMLGLPGRNLTYPPYSINNAAGVISDKTINTDIVHANGLVEYDTHNLYGTMMSAASRLAMLARKPTERPLVITRSTFAGAGRQVGHWLGDNVSDFDHYRISIKEMLEFAALFQVPMVGSDVCGYAGDTDQFLCARWAQLGAFYPFYRNHDASGVAFQEYYLWPLVTEAAKVAIDARYRLLDYLYTAFYTQNQTGAPLLNPLFFVYPNDANTFGIQLQYFYGDSILVSPVTDNTTTVNIYMPNDQFYDFFTYAPVRGHGSYVTLSDVAYTQIPVHIKGGAVLPLRASSAMTTAQLRTRNFNFVVAPGLDGTATGTLYMDDGISLTQAAVSSICLTYKGGLLSTSGSFGFNPNVVISTITLLGASATMSGGTPPAGFSGHTGSVVFNSTAQTLTSTINAPLTKPISVQMGSDGWYGTW